MVHMIFTPNPGAGHAIRQFLGKQAPDMRGCKDELSVGPLQPLDDLWQFATTRSRFWRSLKTPVSTKALFASLQALRAALKTGPVEVWVGSTVQEQVSLLAFLALARGLDLPDGHIRLVQFSMSGAGIGLGGYLPEDLADHSSAEAIGPATRAVYAKAWEALVSSTPHALFALARRGTGLLPLDRTLKALVQRYPEQKSGLGSIERRVLRAFKTNNKFKAAYIVANAMAQNGPYTDMVGDGILFARLMELDGHSHGKPLVEIYGIGREMRRTEVRITPFGRACLAGEANRIKANGIEQHIAGVRLSSDSGRVWLRSGAHLAAP